MNLEGIEYERLQPIVPEAYACPWNDRHKLALALLAEGKGMTIRQQKPVEVTKGFMRFPYAVITVDSYSQ